jgi:hypothetical protein
MLFFSASAFGVAPWWETGELSADSHTIGLWHFNANAGLLAGDSSGNGNDFTLTNASIWDAATKKFGASSISPANTYWGTQADLFDTVPPIWSVGAWVAPTSLYNNTVATHEELFDRCGGATGCGTNKIVCYWVANNGYLRCYIETGGSTYAVISDRVSWPQDEWHYVQVIFDGANLELRVDGVLGVSGSVAAANLTDGDFGWSVGIANDLASNKSLFRVDEMEVASVDRNITIPGAAADTGDLNLTSGDLNLTRIDGYDANATPFFSYFHDGNLTIDFNVSNADNNTLFLDLNYSSTNVQGTGTRIFEDLKLVPANDLNGGFNQVFDSNRWWGFSTDANSVIVDTTIKHSGNSSIRAGVVSRTSASVGGYINYSPPGTWNLNDWNSGYAEFYTYIPSNAVFTSFRFVIANSGGQEIMYSKNFSEFSLGDWTYWKLKLGDWSGSYLGGLPDFNAVDRIIFQTYGTGADDSNFSFWVDDFRLLPGTTNPCIPTIWKTTPSACSIDWNISSSLVSDGNYFLLFDLNRSSYFPSVDSSSFFKASGKTVGIANNPLLHIFVWDENKMTKILTASAKVNGTTYSSGADGNLLVPATSYSGETIVSIGQDGNYAWRNYLIDFSVFLSNRDFNAVLLKDVNGQSVGFEFYSEDGTTKLTNELVTVIKDMNATPVLDNNIAGISRLSGGQATFFLNPDANYVFKVANTSIKYYYKVAGTIQLPKNEVSLASISPFDLTVSGIGSVRYLANATPVVHYFFPNTLSSYIFDVNAGLSYYNRQYFVLVKGNPHTYSLQPYLVARADSIQSIFFVRNSVSAAGIPDIRIHAVKNIPSQGTVNVEDVITDSAGEGVLSFITNDTYYIYFYRDGEIVYNVELRPTSTSYQVYLDLDKIVVPESVWSVVDVNFMPRGGVVWIMPDGNIDLNQAIHVTGGTLSNTRVVVTNSGNRPAGTVLYDKNFDANSSTQFFQQEFDVDVNLSRLSPIKVTVYVTLSDGNVRTFSAAYSISGSTETGGQLFLALTTTMQDVFGSGGMMIISFLIILFVVGGTFGMGVDMGGSGILAVIVAAALAYLGWIPWLVWGAMALAATVLYVLTKRVEY